MPLVGEFQVENALVAAGLAIATGSDAGDVFAALEGLHGAKGRLELVGDRNGAPIFVDYAHKPDALAKALDALRPYVKRRLVVVFGAGGDRDQGKRPLMGAIAAEKADRVIVTDDNPRSENAAAIRQAILAAAPGAIEIGDRRDAIGRAIAELTAGDVLLDRRQRPRNRPDRRQRCAAVFRSRGRGVGAAGTRGMSAAPLWTVDAMAAAMHAAASGTCHATSAEFPSTAARVGKGDAFFAIKGDSHDGHDFVATALKAGAGRRGGRRGSSAPRCRPMRRCWWSRTCWRD